jgi:hypothetical protein
VFRLCTTCERNFVELFISNEQPTKQKSKKTNPNKTQNHPPRLGFLNRFLFILGGRVWENYFFFIVERCHITRNRNKFTARRSPEEFAFIWGFPGLCGEPSESFLGCITALPVKLNN